MFYREVLITIAAHSLAPRGVIRPVDIYLDDPDHWIIVMEKADGDVSHLLEDPDTLNKFHQAGAVAGRPIPEIIIREIYAQPIMAIYLMNKAHITHRDIKNENLLYSCSGGPCRVMIADFGFSTLTDAELMTEPFCGTPYVLPLCMLNGSYGNRNHRRTMDVYGIISSIHVAASYEGKLKASTPEKLTDSTTLVSKKEMSSKASVLEEKEKMSFLSTVVQKGKGVLRYWKGGAFVKRPISDELKAIFKAVLIQENWEPNPKTIGQLIPLLHSWAHAPLLGGPLLTSL
ncbi:kinase-like domain-containing protein [Piptocephalis cylindrospora]|uniref:Kinase-like domain-containing protein n=1 Tax=Piptocephalis cylindrospora TaxID=1907219 RepID=A0A4P9Y229_9FUNG|nr:kinase-like domain-containing protein [Piptocephalis cylindrospora]|eukprot:RKP12813.1 kinase-like domain-containing protein [Piptocephalis cylindrospora]